MRRNNKTSEVSTLSLTNTVFINFYDTIDLGLLLSYIQTLLTAVIGNAAAKALVRGGAVALD